MNSKSNLNSNLHEKTGGDSASALILRRLKMEKNTIFLPAKKTGSRRFL
jgi:hypothetical protein